MDSYYLKYKKYKTKYLNLQYGGKFEFKGYYDKDTFEKQQLKDRKAELAKAKGIQINNPLKVYDDIKRQLSIIHAEATNNINMQGLLPNIKWTIDKISEIQLQETRTPSVYADVEAQLNIIKNHAVNNIPITSSVELIQASISKLKS